MKFIYLFVYLFLDVFSCNTQEQSRDIMTAGWRLELEIFITFYPYILYYIYLEKKTFIHSTLVQSLNKMLV